MRRRLPLPLPSPSPLPPSLLSLCLPRFADPENSLLTRIVDRFPRTDRPGAPLPPLAGKVRVTWQRHLVPSLLPALARQWILLHPHSSRYLREGKFRPNRHSTPRASSTRARRTAMPWRSSMRTHLGHYIGRSLAQMEGREGRGGATKATTTARRQAWSGTTSWRLGRLFWSLGDPSLASLSSF